jgi:hypothetical protein
MNEEFVPYEQSLALRQFGFNLKCFASWQKNGSLLFCDRGKWIRNFEVDPDVGTLELHISRYPHNVMLIDGVYYLLSCNNFTAPIYQQVFRWFRDRYRLHSYVLHFGEDNTFGWKIDDDISYVDFTDGFCVTYEEAELACLIKLIEIVRERREIIL